MTRDPDACVGCRYDTTSGPCCAHPEAATDAFWARPAAECWTELDDSEEE